MGDYSSHERSRERSRKRSPERNHRERHSQERETRAASRSASPRRRDKALEKRGQSPNLKVDSQTDENGITIEIVDGVQRVNGDKTYQAQIYVPRPGSMHSLNPGQKP